MGGWVIFRHTSLKHRITKCAFCQWQNIEILITNANKKIIASANTIFAFLEILLQ